MALLLLLAYFIGSVPFGLLLARAAGFGDIRKIGSGGTGATNVARTGNKWLAIATVLLDAGKGALAVSLAFMIGFSPPGAIVVGIFVVLGHCFPVWLNFKGGKGFATFLGVLLMAAPIAGLISCVAWIAAVFFTRISSVGALCAITFAPIACAVMYGLPAGAMCLAMSALVAGMHHANIKRLISKTEPRIDEPV